MARQDFYKFRQHYDQLKRVKVFRDFVLDPAQTLAFRAKMRGGKPYEVILLVAGQGAGKTFLLPIWLFAKAYQYHQNGYDKQKPFVGLMGGPDGPHIQQVLIPKLIETFGGMGAFDLYPSLGKLKKGSSPTSGFIQLSPTFCKGTIYFRHLQEGLKIQGRHLNGMVIDEVDIASHDTSYNISEEVWKVIRDRTRRYSREILMGTTPYRLGWVYYEVYLPSRKVQFRIYFRDHLGRIIDHEKWLEMGADIYAEARLGKAGAMKAFAKFKEEYQMDWEAVLKSEGVEPYLSIIYPNILSPYYPPEAHIEAYLYAKADGDLGRFRMFAMGEWIVSDTLIFGKYITPDIIVSEEPPHSKDVWVGVDFGFGESPNALCFVSKTNDGKWYVMAEWQGHEQPEDTANRLIDTLRRNGWEPVEINYDASAHVHRYRAGQNTDEATIARKFLNTLEYGGIKRTICHGILANRAESFGHVVDVMRRGDLLLSTGARMLRNQLGTMERTDLPSTGRKSHAFHLIDALRMAIYTTEEKRAREFHSQTGISSIRVVRRGVNRIGHRGRFAEVRRCIEEIR